MVRLLLSACLAWLIAAVPAAASGIALFLINERHDSLRTAEDAPELLRLVRRFEAAGFDTDQATDLSAPALRAALTDLDRRIADERPERVVIVFAGYSLHNDSSSWLMGADASEPGRANIDTIGVRLETPLAVAERIQGGSIVAIADLGYPERMDDGFDPGISPVPDVPQGVSLLSGRPDALRGVLDEVIVPGTNLGDAVDAYSDVRLRGFDPAYLTFLPDDHEPESQSDRDDWRMAEDEGTIAAYRAYLDAWPDGLFAGDARSAIEELESSPERVEDDLGLTREERRAVQRDLTILNFDPRGIDGIFGSGTRAAIRSWQSANDHTRTGYLDRDQIFQLAGQAARRAAELEEEARERQAQQDREDRQYWRDTGGGRDEAGLRAYLERYPDGIFSNIARERLDEIEEERRNEAEARDREAWDRARRNDTAQAYERYLRDYPEGAFVEEARARIRELTRPERERPDIEAARQEEEALGLPRFTRMMIERQLASRGFDPGTVDGELDGQTRRAIRRYQRAADMPVTGYLTQGLVAQLMADSVFQLFE
ncbi:MAG: putative peptidoglycan-binding domain-containing protein [Rhodobacteraceae bacterium HLUCCA12]|nr:MAG: putative peptidoglycan-binding domain-containing protein [Rhodobacteraceae bacterium HLUCCA12]